MRVVATSVNITDRKLAEERVRASHDRLKKVLSVDAVGIMFWDLNTHVLVDANDRFLQMVGFSRADLESGELTWRKLTPPECHAISELEMARFSETGRVGPYEKEYFRKDGTRMWLLFAGSALENDQCVEFCVDIADRKRAEAALQESDRRKDEFLATLSHELRNPLATIRSGLELFKLAADNPSMLAETRELINARSIIWSLWLMTS